MKRFFVVFLLVVGYLGVVGQVFLGNSVIDVLSDLKKDSIQKDWQLKGLMAGLNDSSAIVKAKSLDRFGEASWPRQLPDSILELITWQIDTTEKSLLTSINRTLLTQDYLSDTILKQIALLLKDSDSNVRRSAADALGRQEDLSDAILKQITLLLKDSDFYVRRSAADALGQQEGLSEAILKQIALLFKDSDRDVRRFAVDALGQQEGLSDTYLKQIVLLLKDSDRDVLSSAADALGQQEGLSEAILKQIALLFKDSDRNVRRFAVDALGQQEGLSDAYLKQIALLLKDSDIYVRRSAIYVLGKQKGLSDTYLKQIALLLKDSDRDVFSSAEYVLSKQEGLSEAILKQIALLLKDSESHVRSSARYVLGQQEGLSEAILKQIALLLKDSDNDVRRSAEYVLGQQEGLSEAILKQITLQLKDSDSIVRRSAADALGQQEGLSEAILKQIALLLKDSDSIVRNSAADALGQQEGLSEAILKQIALLFKDSDRNVRRSAADALGQQEGLSEAILKQIALLLKDSDSNIRRSAAYALGKQKGLSDTYLKQIALLLRDSDRDVRRSAAYALGKQKGLSDTYLKQIALLLKDSESHVRRSAADALGQQKGLSDTYLKQIVLLLKDSQNYIRSSAVNALGQQEALSEAILKQIALLLKDSDRDVRGSAVDALGQYEGLSDTYLKQIVLLLKDSERDVRRSVWRILYKFRSDSRVYIIFPYATEFALQKNEDTYIEKNAFQYRVPLYELSGGNDSILYLLKWLCRPLPGKFPKGISIEEARETLDLMLGLEVNSDSLPLFSEEMGLAMPELIKTVEGHWEVKDVANLKRALAFIEKSNPKNAAYIGDVISSLQTKSWLYRISLFLFIHFLIWVILFLAYPYFEWVRERFFWNSTVRKWGGLGYVNELIVLIPFLRRWLFAPYRESLIGEVYTGSWQEVEYYPESLVYGEKEKKIFPVGKVLQPLKRQKILEGESGLGKSMFLRNLAVKSNQVVVYLPATSCIKGLIPPILHKVPVAANDQTFLKRLVYSGAIDILIDGLNEISAEARSSIKLEVDQFLKGNILLTTQPMEWEPPISASKYILKPLEEKQIEEFLLSRYPYLEQKEIIPETAFKDHAKDYLTGTFDSKQDAETLKNNRQILSNPMDLTLVAQLIARGEKPSLLDLQQQQYDLMAADYKLKNLSNDFPLSKFSTCVYNMRLEDQAEIPDEDFKAEIKAMEKWKMVVSRTEEVEGKTLTKWYFRHDKIMEFFLVQEFLENEELAEMHLDDPRFRGVYFLLAYKLEYGDAMKLREMILQYAAESKDHSLSDGFIMLLRGKKKPRGEIIEEIRTKVMKNISQGKIKEGILLIKEKVNGEDEKEAVMLDSRYNDLEKKIRKGTISAEKAILERNQICDSILELSMVIK